MLKAKKSKVFDEIFAIYNRNLMKRRFHSFHLSGLSYLLNKLPAYPLIIYCNHSSWWDGLVAFQVSRQAQLFSYVMMEEKHLKKFFLFRRLGAFSVVRERSREALQSIDYAANLLKNQSSATLWIFPQGEILANDIRPINIFSGLSRIIERTEHCLVTSLSMRYEFLGEYKPQIFAKVEKLELITRGQTFNKKKLTKKFADDLTANLDQLTRDIRDRDLSDYQLIF